MKLMKRKNKTKRAWINDDTLLMMRYMDMSNSNKKLIQEDILWDAGKFVILDGDRTPGLLIGALEDRYDYYWIVETFDLKMRISSCVGGYSLSESDSKLSVLEWMIQNDLDGLKERVMIQLQPYFKEGNRLISDLFFTTER